jgi:hypothetical protein
MKSPVSITLIILSVVLLTSAYHFTWKNEQWKDAVHTDAASYYRYLPMIFIDQELDDQKDNPTVIKYFIGTAFLYLPFFFLACGTSYIAGLPVDGYSMLFPIFISIGTIFYFILGLRFLSKFLVYYFARSWIICTLLCAITVGTIAFFYTVNAPGWAHIVAFSLVCFLLYHLKKITVDYNKASIIAIIAGSSLLFFIRPTDIIILLITPFLASDLQSFAAILKKVFSERRTLLLALFLAAVPMVCQLAIYKIYTDEFFFWSYTKEGFDFLHPEFMKVLLGYEKGLFVYTPICFLALFGLFRLFKINRYLFTGIVIYLFLNAYIISSWWCWNYGCIYGPRAFIEHFPLFFLLLGFLLDTTNKFLKNTVIVSLVLLSMLNLFQIYQAVTGILDQDYRTTAKGYWDVFLRTDKGYSGKFYKIPLDERKENIAARTIWFNDMELVDSTWLNSNTISDEKAHSGKRASKVNANFGYSVGLRKKLVEVPYNKNVLIRVSGWFYVPQPGSNSYFVIAFANNKNCFKFITSKLDGSLQNFGAWEHQVFELYMPKLPEEGERDKDTRVEFYYFNNSTMDCYLDDLSIEFIQFKKMDRVLDISWE